jgi:excisionase family DNA binding protein
MNNAGTDATIAHQSDGRRLAVRVSEAARMLDIGRSKAYELIRTGDLPSIRVGKTVRVPVDALEAWVSRQTSGSPDKGES